MRTKQLRCMIWVVLMSFLTAGVAFAGVGGSDTPGITSPVAVGQEGVNVQLRISNTSFSVEGGQEGADDIKLVSIVYVSTCGSASNPNLCGADEAAGTITISSVPIGDAGTACDSVTFSIAPTGLPNEYELSPNADVIFGPADDGGPLTTCIVRFTVNVNLKPTTDSSGSAGLQTSQLTHINLLDVTETSPNYGETGGGAGTSTTTVLSPCLRCGEVLRRCHDLRRQY